MKMHSAWTRVVGILITVSLSQIPVSELTFAQNSVRLETVSNLVAMNIIPVLEPVTFTFHHEMNLGSEPVGGFFTHYDLYSPDGASWVPGTASWSQSAEAVALRHAFGPSFEFIQVRDWDGQGEDSVLFSSADTQSPFTGVASFSGNLTVITIPSFDIEDTGKTICIDSATNFPPTTLWEVFGANNPVSDTPSYGGGPFAANYTPGMGYCFTLGYRAYVCGDINNDPIHQITVTDLTYLINYLFNNGPDIPSPVFRANLNCLGNPGPTQADNTYLIRFLFDSGPAPCENCPQ